MQTQNRDVIGLDIAKTIFHAHVAASDGRTGDSRRLRRKELLDWAASREPLMVKGSLEGAEIARRVNVDVLFFEREGDRLRQTQVGRLFDPRPVPGRAA